MNMHIIPWSRYPLTSADKHNQLHTQLISAMTLSSNIYLRGSGMGSFSSSYESRSLSIQSIFSLNHFTRQPGKKLTEEILDKRCMVVITKNNSRRESTENEFVYLWMWRLKKMLFPIMLLPKTLQRLQAFLCIPVASDNMLGIVFFNER